MVEKVLRAAELVPPGRVASYGDLGAVVGIGPRFVGRVLSHWGSDVPWWRVTSAAGEYPPELRERAFAHWREEGIVVKPNGRGCRIADFRCDLDALAEAWERAVEHLAE